MTGAGSAQVAFAPETGFRNLDTPNWRSPGENVSVSTASLENALRRARKPNQPIPDGSLEGNKEGALNVSFTVTDTNFHDLIFADGGTGLAQSASLAPTAAWYLSAETLNDGKEERILSGAAVESVTISYSQGQDVTVDLTIIYAYEPEVGGTYASPPTEADITQPSKSDVVRHHGFDLTVAGGQVEQLQSAELSVSGMARFRRGQDQIASDAVVGAYEPSLTVQANLLNGDQKALAYGSSTATEPLTEVEETSAEVTLENPAGPLATYDLSRVQPTTYDWSDLVSPDTDTTDPTTYHVSNVQSV